MGMSTRHEKSGLAADINVTPLIDVLLVLLIIFLVAMPLLMKMETLRVPDKLPPDMLADPKASQLTVTVGADLSMTLNDGVSDQPVASMAELKPALALKLGAMSADTDKVVFVDFADAVPWNIAISTMDSIRSIATDANHDDVKIALKVRDETVSR
jgi:biopolymer transport protein TolR